MNTKKIIVFIGCLIFGILFAYGAPTTIANPSSSNILVTSIFCAIFIYMIYKLFKSDSVKTKSNVRYTPAD